MNYFKAYFSLSFILVFLNTLTIFLNLPQQFNLQLFLFFGVGFLLLLSIDEKFRKQTIVSFFLVILSTYLVLSIFSNFSLYTNLIIHSLGSILLFSILMQSALSKAKQLNNIGFKIISIAFFIVIVFSFFEIAYLYLNNLKIAYTFAYASASTGFILVIIGSLVQMLMSEYNILNTIALTDPLTGMNNRRGLYHLLESIIPSSNRDNKCYSIIAMDIDFFKKVNDTYGHDGGDIVLKEFSNMIKNTHRNTDISARIGGEEFILILPETDKQTALKIAEKLRINTESLEIKIENAFIKITSSFGVETTCNDFDLDKLFKNADKALYESKFSGKNKVIHIQDLS